MRVAAAFLARARPQGHAGKFGTHEAFDWGETMNRIHCVLVGSLALSLAALGCSKEHEGAPAQGAQGVVGAEQGVGSTFRFVPQSRSFTQTTVDTKTLSQPGSSFSSEIMGEYTWAITGKPEGTAATYSAELQRV